MDNVGIGKMYKEKSCIYGVFWLKVFVKYKFNHHQDPTLVECRAHEIEKKIGVTSEFALATMHSLTFHCPFCLAVQLFFGVPVPQFDQWHLALGMLLFYALDCFIPRHLGPLFKARLVLILD